MTTTSTECPYLTRRQAAAELGIGLYAINQAIEHGDLKALKIGARILIPRESFRAWLKSCELGD